MARRNSAAEERRRGRPGPKSIRGRISDPIPISSPLDEMLLAKSHRAACSFVPVTRIDLPPATALALANPRRSFVVVGAAGAEGAGLLPPSPGSRPNRFSDYWSPPSRLEHRISQTVSEPAPPPRSELRLSVHVAASGDAQPSEVAGTGTSTSSTSSSSSSSSGTSIRDALRHIFGWKRARRAEPVEPAKPVENLLTMQDQLKTAWRHDGPAPVMSVPRRPCLSREHDGMASVTDYNRALRSHSVGVEDILAIQSARNSIVRCQSCASTESSCPASPLWTGPTALKPRPAATEDQGHPSPAHVAEDPCEAAAPETPPPRDVPSPQPPSSANDGPVISLSPAANLSQPRPECSGEAEDIGARHHHHTGLISGETPNSVAEPVSLTDPFGDPGLDMADAARLQKRLSGIEDHLHRVEALLARVCRIIPECQPRSEGADCKLPASLSSYAQQTVPDSPAGCSSPSSAVYGFSRGEASLITDELPGQPLRASASVTTLRDENVSSFTLGPLTALMSLIESERSSSSVLESGVRELAQKVQLLTQDSPLFHEGRRSFGGELGAAIPRNDGGVDGDDFPAGPNQREISV